MTGVVDASTGDPLDLVARRTLLEMAVAASEITQMRVRVLRSMPGRVHSVPNTASVATSMNLRIMGSV